MPKYEFVGQSSEDSDNVSANTSRLLNMHRERVMAGGRTDYVLRTVLGQDARDDIGTSPVRSMGRANNLNWLVGGGDLYELAADGTTTQRATVADDVNTTLDGNYTDTTVVADGRYFVWDGTAVTEPTGAAFTDFGSHTYVGGYTVLTERGGRRFQWTGQGNATSFDALDFASAEVVDDNILRAVEFQGSLLLFCETSTEIWQITGAGATAFSYVTTRNIGLKDFNLLVRFDDALFFVGNDNRAYLFNAGSASAGAIETSLQENNATHCFYYEDEGHKHCVIRFSDRPAWVFDVTEREWHERSETAGHAQWAATHSIRNGDKWLVGNTEGQSLELARTAMDRGGPLYRRVIGYVHHTGERHTINRFEVLGRVGDHDLTSSVETAWAFSPEVVWEVAPGIAWVIKQIPAGERPALISLSESNDGGRTYRTPKARSMGVLGDYTQRMVWRKRGQFRQYTPRIDINEPADITLYATAVIE